MKLFLKITLSFLAIAALWRAASARADELRTWKDATGAFSVEAALVKVEKGQVHLRREDGKEVVVPLERLSTADRQFIATEKEENPFRPVIGSQRTTPPVVLVAIKSPTGDHLVNGLVYRTTEEKSYVVFDTRLSQGGDRRPRKDVDWELTAIWQSGKKQQQTKLELVTHRANGKHSLACAAAKELPPALVFNPALEIKEGMPLRFAGCRADPDTKDFSFIESELEVTGITRDSAGEVTGFATITKQPHGKIRGAVVLNELNEAVGIFNLLENNTEGSFGPNANFSAVPAVFPWERPDLLYMMVYPKSGDRKEIVWNVLVEVHDPLKTIDKSYVLWEQAESAPITPLPAPLGGAPVPSPFKVGLPKVALKPGKHTEESLTFVPPPLQKLVNTGEVLVRPRI